MRWTRELLGELLEKGVGLSDHSAGPTFGEAGGRGPGWRSSSRNVLASLLGCP